MNTKKFVTSAASVITAGALIIGGTMAYFTDNATSTGNTLGAGTLAIELRDFGGALINGPIFDSEAAEPLYPGGPSTFACATVLNAGSLDFNWTIKGVKTSDGDPDLADALWGRTRTWIGAEGGPVSPADCADNDNWTTGDAELPISAILPIGEVKQGLLGVDGKTHFRWEYFLPTGVGNEFNGANTTLTFEVNAYQINDPAYDLAFPPTP